MMNRNEAWDAFLDQLLSGALARQETSEEYTYLHQRWEEIEEMLTTNLTDGEKEMVDEVLYELGQNSTRETGLGYRQGMLDCVWLLKRLGVLA